VKSLKIALSVSALFTLTPLALALEAVDDEVLSEVSGQEGISIDQSYNTTIEEWTWVDGDGDGSTGQAAWRWLNSENGNFVGADMLDNSATTNRRLDTRNMTIDATANGVIITTGDVGYEGDVIINDANQFQELTKLGITTDASGNLTDGSGMKLRGIGDGEEWTYGEVVIGKHDGSGEGNIGSVHIVNRSNYNSTYGTLVANNKFGMGLDVTDSNRFTQRALVISSKTSGTGVHMFNEQGYLLDQGNMNLQTTYYQDDDGAGGNQAGFAEWTTFRRVSDPNNMFDRTNTGNYTRGALQEYDLEVEDGKLVLANQLNLMSIMVNKIYIGDAADAINNGQGVIGGILVDSSRTVGSTSYYAH